MQTGTEVDWVVSSFDLCSARSRLLCDLNVHFSVFFIGCLCCSTAAAIECFKEELEEEKRCEAARAANPVNFLPFYIQANEYMLTYFQQDTAKARTAMIERVVSRASWT